MEPGNLLWIITTALTLGYVASSPLQHSAPKSSLSPTLLRKLLHAFRNGPQEKNSKTHPDYGTVSPIMLGNFDRYDWQYSEYDHSSRRIDLRRLKHHKRQSGFPPTTRNRSGRIICARNKSGKCIAKCGFGAPLDEININRFFGCKSLNNRNKQT